MSEHTDGPWRAIWGEQDGDPYFDICTVQPDVNDDGRLVDYGGSIVEMAFPVIQDEDEARANADLMAAAPELLAVAQRVIELTNWHEKWPAEKCPWCDLRRKAQYAIASARGEYVRED